MINEYLSANEYEQLPVPVEDEHTYGNVESAPLAPPGESVYEITQIQDSADEGIPYGNLAERNFTMDVAPPTAKGGQAQGNSVYENVNYV